MNFDFSPDQRSLRDQGALLGMTAEELTRQRAKQVPLGRLEKPEGVAHVVPSSPGRGRAT